MTTRTLQEHVSTFPYLEVGHAVYMIESGSDPDPVPRGDVGLVTRINEGSTFFQASVDWLSGRRLMLVEADRFAYYDEATGTWRDPRTNDERSDLS